MRIDCVRGLFVALLTCQLALSEGATAADDEESVTEIVFNAMSTSERMVHQKHINHSRMPKADELNVAKNESVAVAAPVVADQKDYEAFYTFMQQLTGLYLYPVISVFGIIGNCFMIVVYKESKKYSTNFYLIALSFSDIIKLVNDFMYFLVTLIAKIDPNLSSTIFVSIYNYSHYIFIFSALNTSWLTCAIAFDRYIAIVGKQLRKQHFNYLQSIIVSVTIFVLSLVLAIPSPFFIKSAEEFDPVKNATVKVLKDTALGQSQFKKVYQYFNALLRAVIPFLLLVYLNFRIIRVVYTNKMKKKAMTNNKKNTKTKSRVTLMLITIVLTFTLCIFPDAIMTMMQLGYANESYLVRGIREITDLLLAINSAVPFPICYYFSSEFRGKFRTIFMSQSAKNELSNKCMVVDSVCPDENTVLVSQAYNQVNLAKAKPSEKSSASISVNRLVKGAAQAPGRGPKRDAEISVEDNLSNLVL